MQINDYINALPDAYRKDAKSNNYKLLLIEQTAVQALRDDLQALSDIMDIRNATGKTLDYYGSIYAQARGYLSDDQYRYLILQKATRSISGCDNQSIVNALSAVFAVPVEEVSITDSDENCVAKINALPYRVLHSAGITAEQVRHIVSTMLAVGVRLAEIHFEGTFEFAEFENEYDPSKGFGDINQTIGGYLGLLDTGEGVLEGTLEFATYHGELDEEKGFGNEAQTVGGYLGLLPAYNIRIPV